MFSHLLHTLRAVSSGCSVMLWVVLTVIQIVASEQRVWGASYKAPRQDLCQSVEPRAAYPELLKRDCDELLRLNHLA